MKNKIYDSHGEYLGALKRNKRSIISVQIGLLVGFMLFWELGVFSGLMDGFITSSPSRIFFTGLRLFATKAFYYDIGLTLLECVIGFAVSTVVGSVIAVVLWWFDFARKVLEPYVVVLNSLPKIALGPLIIIWVGTGMPAIITMTVLISIIITIMSMLHSFLEVEEEKILLLKSMGATKFQILWKLILPHCIPNLLSVLKINVGLSWVGTIMGEFLVSDAGLGYQIVYGGTVFQHDLVMTCTVVLCILAAVMYFVVAKAEKFITSRRS